MWGLKQAKYQVLLYYQGHDATNMDYVEHFKALFSVL
jgi:hypothetical protein